MGCIRVAIFGWDGFTCQIPRIKEGMKSIGNTISENNPELIYCNDPSGYQKALALKKKFQESYLIFNFLDVPWHFPKIEEKMKVVSDLLYQADSVTAISHKVKNDLSKFYKKKISVIYNPIKDVKLDENIKKNNMFLYVGRAKDPIKRINLVHDSLLKIENGIKDIKICGSENPGFGNYLGVVSDEELNRLYNSTKYVYLPSKAEGIGLSMIEGMICGSIPITCSDNETAKEFSPLDFICEPNPQSIVNKIKMLSEDYKSKRELAIEYGKKYKVQFDKKNIAKNIMNIFNSR